MLAGVPWDNRPSPTPSVDPPARARQPRPDRRPPTTSATRHDLRNVAIVAHVDHGKTTLVDAMLRQTGAFRANQAVVDRVMDSRDLEREKGITILAKQTTVDYADIRLNIVDTPGHADFGGRGRAVPAHGRLGAAARRRGRGAAAADALRPPEGDGAAPAGRSSPSTRSTARDARPAEVLDDVYELFIDLGADERPDRVPGRLHERQGRHGDHVDSASPARTCGRCSTSSSRSRRRRPTRPDHPLQLLVTNLTRQRLRRADGGRPDLERHDPGRPADHRRPRGGRRHGRDRRARPDGDPHRHRHEPPDRPRHRARRHRRGRAGRHRRGRGPARGHDRRHAHRPRRSAAAARASTSTRRRSG